MNIPPSDRRATETQGQLQPQGLAATASTATQAGATAMPENGAMMESRRSPEPVLPDVTAGHLTQLRLQGLLSRGEAPYFEPPWIARRLAAQIAAAERGRHSPTRGFGDLVRSQDARIDLPPALDLGSASTLLFSEGRHSPRQRQPASGVSRRRGRELAFDDDRIPPSLRPTRQIRDLLQSAPMAFEGIVASWSAASSSEALTTLQSNWRDISTEDGAQPFGEFLVRLNNNVNAGNLPFRQQTADLLNQMRSDPALRQQVFAISVEATTSCEDRISHTMIMMQTAARTARFKHTSFDTDADAIVVQRQFHRLDLLHEMAQTIVEQTGNGKEEIETHLHLLIRHVDELELKGCVPPMDMFFDGCAQVSRERSATIAFEIRQQENAKFPGWLAHSPSWIDYIARTDKARFDTAQTARDTFFDTGFAQRLDARLSELGLDKDADPAVRADAERLLGKKLSEEKIDEINTGLTNDFLAARGNLHLLDKYWTEKECTLPSLSRLAA